MNDYSFTSAPQLKRDPLGGPLEMANVGNYASVLKFKLAVAFARRRGDALVLAHRVRHLGDAYRRVGGAALSEQCYLESLAIYRQHKQTKPLDFANAVRGLAVLKQEVGALAEARRLWQEAHDLDLTADVPAGVAESTSRLAALGS